MVTTDVVVARETLETCFDEARPLLEAHWREIATWPDIPLHVDVAGYTHAELAGRLRIYTARQDGRLVGYAVFFVAPHPHYVDSVQAVQDVVFVSPDCRRGRVGYELLRQAERALRDDGVQVIVHHVKRAHPTLGVLLERMGYTAVETIYAKRVD